MLKNTLYLALWGWLVIIVLLTSPSWIEGNFDSIDVVYGTIYMILFYPLFLAYYAFYQVAVEVVGRNTRLAKAIMGGIFMVALALLVVVGALWWDYEKVTLPPWWTYPLCFLFGIIMVLPYFFMKTPLDRTEIKHEK